MASESRTRIAMLHRIRPDRPVAFGLPDSYRIRGTSLTPDELRDRLNQEGPFLPLGAVEDALEAGRAPPPGTVLTFDDGYREHLEKVAPLLRERGIEATFYVASGLTGEGSAVAAVDGWYFALDHARRAEGRVTGSDGRVYARVLDDLEDKRWWVLGPPKQALLEASGAKQRRMIDELAESLGVELPEDLAARLYLRRDEWEALVEAGQRVGAHSVSHPRLTGLTDEELAWEVEASVEAVRERIGGPVAFAYPDGDWDGRVEAVVRAAGVRSAVTCEAGSVRVGEGMWGLRRVFWVGRVLAKT